jgi:hypothetical protein
LRFDSGYALAAMSIENNLKNALSAVGNARRVLRRARLNSPHDIDIKRAIRELEDAESDIDRAVTEIQDL